jgi:hypothetical protein
VQEARLALDLASLLDFPFGIGGITESSSLPMSLILSSVSIFIVAKLAEPVLWRVADVVFSER